MYRSLHLTKSAIIIWTINTCSQVFAHPGHIDSTGGNGQGISHWLLEPTHSILPAAIALGLAVLTHRHELRIVAKDNSNHRKQDD